MTRPIIIGSNSEDEVLKDGSERPETDYERWLKEQHGDQGPDGESSSPRIQPMNPLYGDRDSTQTQTLDSQTGLKGSVYLYIILTIFVVGVVVTRLRNRRRPAFRSENP